MHPQFGHYNESVSIETVLETWVSDNSLIYSGINRSSDIHLDIRPQDSEIASQRINLHLRNCNTLSKIEKPKPYISMIASFPLPPNHGNLHSTLILVPIVPYIRCLIKSIRTQIDTFEVRLIHDFLKRRIGA